MACPKLLLFLIPAAVAFQIIAAQQQQSSQCAQLAACLSNLNVLEQKCGETNGGKTSGRSLRRCDPQAHAAQQQLATVSETKQQALKYCLTRNVNMEGSDTCDSVYTGFQPSSVQPQAPETGNARMRGPEKRQCKQQLRQAKTQCKALNKSCPQQKFCKMCFGVTDHFREVVRAEANLFKIKAKCNRNKGGRQQGEDFDEEE